MIRMKKTWGAVSLCALLGLAGCKSMDKAAQKMEDTGEGAAVATKEAAAETEAAAAEMEKTSEEVQAQATQEANKARLMAAIADANRPAEQRARDLYRHPYETLTFFEVRPESHVLELWPGGGWYTRILSAYVGENGKLYVTNASPKDPLKARAQMSKDYDAMVKTLPYNDNITVMTVANPKKFSTGLEDQVDVVLTFRNVHNWVKENTDKTVYEEAFKALKPGGIFGIVEHRGPKGMTRAQSAKTGYLDQDGVIAAVEAAGFKFVEASEINANAKDTKDYKEGVWTLPPTLRLKDKDSAKYMEIGESDRMTLKFMKPEVEG